MPGIHGSDLTVLTSIDVADNIVVIDNSVPETKIIPSDNLFKTGTAATATTKGVVELATDAEVTTGSDTSRVVTPAGLHQKTASATAVGIVELATDAETLTGTDTGRAVTPANIVSKTKDEDDMVSDSASHLATQQSIKAYVDAMLFSAGTVMVFGQTSAPTGWTKKTDWSDISMLVYTTGTIGSGGSADPKETHTHTGPSHIHTGPSHTHGVTVPVAGWGTGAGGSVPGSLPDCTLGTNHLIGGDRVLTSAAGGTGATGAGGTGATGANTAPKYQSVIAATKD